MSANESPIFCFLQAAYVDIEIKDGLFKISDTLNDMVKSQRKCLPVHLKVFFEKLHSGLLIKELDDALSISIQELKNNPCKNCSTCSKCCEMFYAALVQTYIDEEHGASTKMLEKWENNDILKPQNNSSFIPVPSNIRKHIVSGSSIHDMYSKQKRRILASRDIENSLIVLKGLSSSTPYLYNGIVNNGHFTGGGLFIKWHGLGIVIDPGFGFIENMQKNKIFVDDIDVVIITHFHIDHTNDIRLLDDLNRSINPGLKDFEKNEDYEKFSHTRKITFHRIKWYVDSDTHQSLMPYLNPLINQVNKITSDKFNSVISLSECIDFTPFQTEHVELNHFEGEQIITCYKNNTFGVKLTLHQPNCNDIHFGYTSDTAYSANLLKNLQDSTCLVANISGIYEDDYLQLKYKGRHLGYAGCKKILEGIKPQMMIISEFWNGITDLRYDICKDLQSHTTGRVLPGEIGLQVNLRDCSIRCSICGNYTDQHKVAIVSPIEQMGKISFICDKCRY